MNQWIKELTPILAIFFSATCFAGFFLFNSMSEWFSTKTAGAYIGYSLTWYFITPLMFVVGWYASIVIIIALINLYAIIFR